MPDAPPGGYLHLVPTVLQVGMTPTTMTASVLPWLAPSFSGMVGTTTGEQSEPVISISFEWPMSWLRTVEELSRFDREWLLLRRFSSDQALALGRHAFGDVQCGPDPPDATVATDGGRMGVESTALTIQSRREVHGLFMRLRRALQQTEPVAFAKLAGRLIYVWFEEPDSMVGKPHRRSDREAIEVFVRALAEYSPNDQQLWVPSGPLPQTAPAPPIETTTAGAKFYSVPLQMAAPSTMLFSTAGFEIGLAYTTMLTASEAWAEIQRLVDSHDKPGVDLLLVTAGGPNAQGNIFPAEEAVADFLLANPTGLKRPPDHIKTVILHSWATGRASTLHPQVEALFGPLFQSAVPLHHPLAVSESPNAAEPPGADDRTPS